MKINIEYEKDNEAYDFFGMISLEHDNQIIKDDCTFMENWFTALIDGYRTIERNSHCEIDLIMEPDLLIFDKKDGFISINYGKQMIKNIKLEDFRKALYLSGITFLEELETRFSVNELKKNSLLVPLYRWLEYEE